jgi:glucan biosynthesis protein C
MVFTIVPWLISDRAHSLVLSALAGAGFTMGMPLLFLLSGAASFFALRKLRAWTFLWLRFRRLVIPMVVGLILLSPFQGYLSARSRGGGGDFYSYFLQFFSGMDAYLSPRWLGNYGYHLWFLGFLFLYSAIGVPLFIWLGRPSSRRFTAALAALCLRRGGLVLFVAPPAAAQILLRSRFPWYNDWADFAYWLMFFIAGYVLVSDARFARAILAHWRAALLTTIVTAVAIGVFALAALGTGFAYGPQYTLPYAAYWLLCTANTWSVVVLVLALGIRFFDHPNRVIDYGSEAVLPFYVLHHPIVVAVAFVVVQWEASLWLKFGIQTVAAFALTVVLYELAIRPFRPMRALFGLRSWQPKGSGEVPEAAVDLGGPERPAAPRPNGPVSNHRRRLASG